MKWRSHFNATAVHSRHGKTRTDIWLKITADQLKKAPSVEVCRELAVAAPELRKVTSKLRVSFRGAEFDVSTVPGVLVGEKLMITRNPWRSDVAQVVLTGEDGHETFFLVEEVRKNEFGFASAAVFGESYKALPETPAQTAAKSKSWSRAPITPSMQLLHARRRRCRSAGDLTRTNISTTPRFRPICRSAVETSDVRGRVLSSVR